MHHRAV